MRLDGVERKPQDPLGSTGSEGPLGADVVGERHALPRSCTTFSGGRAFTIDYPVKEVRWRFGLTRERNWRRS